MHIGQRLNFRSSFAYSSWGENMANIALAALETALRARKLDRTLTTALPPLERSDPACDPFRCTSTARRLPARGDCRAVSSRKWPARTRRGGPRCCCT